MCPPRPRICIPHTCSTPAATFDKLPSDGFPANDDALAQTIIREPTADQKTPLFLLPAELRNQIYEYIFTQKAIVNWSCDIPYTTDHGSWECQPSYPCASYSKTVPIPTRIINQERAKPPSQLGFLLSCRQIWQEAAKTAYSSLNLNIVNISLCRNWKKSLANIPPLLTSQLSAILEQRLEFIQPKRCRIEEPEWNDLPLSLRTRHLIFSTDQDCPDLSTDPWSKRDHALFQGGRSPALEEGHKSGPGENDREFKLHKDHESDTDLDPAPGFAESTFKAMWYLVTTLSGVRKVTMWAKQGDERVGTPLNLQYDIIVERIKDEESREKGETFTGCAPFTVGRVDRDTKSFVVCFAEANGTRNVVFTLT